MISPNVFFSGGVFFSQTPVPQMAAAPRVQGIGRRGPGHNVLTQMVRVSEMITVAAAAAAAAAAAVMVGLRLRFWP